MVDTHNCKKCMKALDSFIDDETDSNMLYLAQYVVMELKKHWHIINLLKGA